MIRDPGASLEALSTNVAGALPATSVPFMAEPSLPKASKSSEVSTQAVISGTSAYVSSKRVVAVSSIPGEEPLRAVPRTWIFRAVKVAAFVQPHDNHPSWYLSKSSAEFLGALNSDPWMWVLCGNATERGDIDGCPGKGCVSSRLFSTVSSFPDQEHEDEKTPAVFWIAFELDAP